ncbi:hypothetical protein PHYSODRAFT_302053 [Phytophthora sojae]|uniref:Uncharacterized protein n=1 Tax=Phytophthora sojae (strain P6497) TaxID=1094619 RepID=G4ZKF0_PHYSP|nr:hypothetical protein PHYSODRAFT_302053 [Phytophthora sojae]EGZ15560.1 hypothetical protein PHYSODRAFT_302053 [Phytophthora sojae]|eukprot:XP_009529309.1 hypothetical protein PHYSODRAFT_302053 [Phytophthora sojae]
MTLHATRTPTARPTPDPRVVEEDEATDAGTPRYEVEVHGRADRPGGNPAGDHGEVGGARGDPSDSDVEDVEQVADVITESPGDLHAVENAGEEKEKRPALEPSSGIDDESDSSSEENDWEYLDAFDDDGDGHGDDDDDHGGASGTAGVAGNPATHSCSGASSGSSVSGGSGSATTSARTTSGAGPASAAGEPELPAPMQTRRAVQPELEPVGDRQLDLALLEALVQVATREEGGHARGRLEHQQVLQGARLRLALANSDGSVSRTASTAPARG